MDEMSPEHIERLFKETIVIIAKNLKYLAENVELVDEYDLEELEESSFMIRKMVNEVIETRQRAEEVMMLESMFEKS